MQRPAQGLCIATPTARCLKADRAGKVFARTELKHEVWKGGVVGYDSVTNTAIKLRKALGDNARSPTYISTVSKRGYQLIARASPAGDEHPANKATAQPLRTAWRSDRAKVTLLTLVAGTCRFKLSDLSF